MSHTITLHNAQQGHETLRSAWEWAKPRLLQGKRLQLSIKDSTRSLEQNAKLHALLTDVSRSIEWAGKKQDAETWKRLFTAAWLRARGESVGILPALDGHGVDVVFRPTSTLTVGECCELIDFIEAWIASR